MSLIKELRRRNVIRMAGLYLVGAWLIVQVAGTVLPMFGAPEWIARSVVILLAIGFMPALILSWVFEMTPGGLKRESELALAESGAPRTARRMDRVIIVVMALALGYFAMDKFVLAPARIPGPAPEGTSSAAPAAPALHSSTSAEPEARAAEALMAREIVLGIAVLPFDNLSPDPDNAFFAGGIHEEVLTKLSRIGELRVISRTSMERIAEQKLEISAIGRRLGVSHVLEGSVRRSGDQIRVTVQLIEAASDAHIWAENYDRQLDDVFAIQSGIALAIADQLKLSLSPQLQANLSEQPTQNQAAYALYLRALDEARTWRGVRTFRAMIELLEPAVAADPEFLDASVLLANAYGRMAWAGEDADGSYADKARQRVADVVQRWPDRPQARVAQGQLAYNLEADYGKALRHFEAARTQLPNDSSLQLSIAGSLKRLGRDEGFLVAARRSVELDPESAIALSELFRALMTNGLLDEALEVSELGRARFPDDGPLQVHLAHARLARDQDLAALLALDSATWQLRDLSAMARFVSGDHEGLARLPDEFRADPVLLAERSELLQLAGREAEALALARQANSALETALAATPASNSPRTVHAMAASVLAQAGERERAQDYLQKALATAPLNELDGTAASVLLSVAERRLGNHESAWLLIQPFAGKPADLSKGELLAMQGFYDRVYGDSPSYRSYMGTLAGQKR